MVEYITKDTRSKEKSTSDDKIDENRVILDPHMVADMIFMREDKDKNGYVSYEEFSGPKSPVKMSPKKEENKTEL